MCKVSIIIPAYNAEKTIEKCINSLINQTYNNFEIIVVNDGSQDKTLELCNSLSLIDSRIVVLTQHNKGVSSARNLGIRNITGDYIMFVDSDDVVDRKYIETYLKYITQNNCDVVIGGITFIQDDKVLYTKIPSVIGLFDEKIWNEICKDNTGVFGYVSNKMYRSSIIKEKSIFFDETIKAQEDLDFALSVYSHCKKFYLISDSLYDYNYIEHKSNHTPDIYIKNQIKMYNISRGKVELDENAIINLYNRINNLLFGALYWSDSNTFYEDIKKFYVIDGLLDILKKEKNLNMALKLFLNKKRFLMKYYFKLRRSVSHFFRKGVN